MYFYPTRTWGYAKVSPSATAGSIARYSPPPGTHGCVLVFRRFVVLRPPRPRLLGEAPSGDYPAGEVQPSRHTLIAVCCRCAHYGELNRVAAYVLKYLSSVVDASVMMRCNMAVADRAMVVVDASAMMRRNIINRNPPPKGVHLNNRRRGGRRTTNLR